MSEGEQIEVRFFVGPPTPIEELLRQVREEEAQESEEVEFVSPHVAGRMSRGASASDGGDE